MSKLRKDNIERDSNTGSLDCDSFLRVRHSTAELLRSTTVRSWNAPTSERRGTRLTSHCEVVEGVAKTMFGLRTEPEERAVVTEHKVSVPPRLDMFACTTNTALKK